MATGPGEIALRRVSQRGREVQLIVLSTGDLRVVSVPIERETMTIQKEVGM